MNQASEIKHLNDVVSVITSMEEVRVSTGIELGAECVELRGEKAEDSLKLPALIPHVMPIPEMSYSSSEDEDFFDASENMGQSPTSLT